MSKINEISTDLKWTSEAAISQNFPMPLDGMVFGENPRKGVFLKNQFIHPELNFSILFPEGWVTSNQPDAVSAVYEDRNAGIFLGLMDNSKTPEQYGIAYTSKLEKKFKKTPKRSEKYDINGNPGYLVSVIDDTEREEMYLHMLWVQIDNKIFQLVGMGPPSQEPILQKSAESLHTLAKEERIAVTKTVLRIREAKGGESLESFLKRNGSSADPSGIALINDIPQEKKLESGQKIKVLVTEPY